MDPDKISRGISKYLSKHQPYGRGEAYEFNIKIRKIDIPEIDRLVEEAKRSFKRNVESAVFLGRSYLSA